MACLDAVDRMMVSSSSRLPAPNGQFFPFFAKPCWNPAMADNLRLVLGALAIAAALAASGHAIIYKREARSAALWLAVIWLAPAVGAILYALLGVNRVRRRAAVLRGDMIRYRAPSAGGVLPDPASPLSQLASLVGKVSGRPLLQGNSLEMLAGGAQAYPAMLEAIGAARGSIMLASYIFHGDGIGARFVEALAAAMGRGVEVRVLIDDVNARFSACNAAKPLRRAGVPVGVFNPTVIPARLHAANLRNHRKILVADGRLGFTGGLNIDRRYWNPEAPQRAFRDTHFRLRGPAVAHLAEVFADDWQFATGQALRGARWFPELTAAGESLVRGVEAGPDESLDRLRWTIIGALNAAQSSARICTPYFIPDSALISALNAAALRGVEVDILLPGKSDLPHVQWAAWGQLWQVLERGCRVWAGRGPFDHSKLMLVDGAWALVGSANWDTRSLRLNFELDVECYGGGLGPALEALLLRKRADSREVTLAEVDARPFLVKLRDGAARLLAPYL
jgi:cardiolipin synthase